MSIYSVARYALILVPITVAFCNPQEVAPTNELGFTLGGIPSVSRGARQETINLGAGTAFGINYGRRLLGGNNIALYGEVNLLASPQRDVSSSIASATMNFASLYVTPGIRLKFFPRHAISPYALVGGGYADYEQSTTLLNGQPNPASRELARGVFDFGAGVDVRVWRWIALRGEARDFYTGSPAYNVAGISGGQNNVAISGGFVVRWH